VTQRRARGDQRGLTLIELVLTLTILALAGALVSGALATGLRAWQSGLRGGREELLARIVLERIATQLRAAVHSPATRNNEPAVAFDAGENRLRFVTLAAAGEAPVQVSYGVRDDRGVAQFVYREYPWPDKAFFDEGRPRREEIIPEIIGLAVKPVKRSDEKGKNDESEPPSSDEWSPLDEELPGSVSVEIVVGAAGQPEPRHYQITVPIPTQRVPE
jgi:prepilin-type N-terminal cleavage/methylation domain-containing protein